MQTAPYRAQRVIDWWKLGGASAMAVSTGFTLGWLYGLIRLMQEF
jgi:hypothetical protein